MYVIVLYKEYVYILLNILSKRRDRSDAKGKVQKCDAEEDESNKSNSNKAWKEDEQGICPRLRFQHSMNLVKEEHCLLSERSIFWSRVASLVWIHLTLLLIVKYFT